MTHTDYERPLSEVIELTLEDCFLEDSLNGGEGGSQDRSIIEPIEYEPL